MNTIYLDNNATTKIDTEVFSEMKPFLTERYGNPSSMHNFGGSVKYEIDKARERSANLIGADVCEIIFTGSGTESDNMAINSALINNPDKKHIITSAVEHPAVLEYCKYLENNRGYIVTCIGVDADGQIKLKELEDAVTENTAIISVMIANNETGIVFPIKQIAEIANKKGVLFHTDAVQAVGKMPVDVNDLNIDMLSFSGHKLHGPKGVGVLYIKKGVKFSPYIIGGHQEQGKRAGTENTASIIGMGKACEIAGANLSLYASDIKKLRDKLEQGLVERIKDTIVNGKNIERAGNTLSISFKFIEGEAILLLLDEQGICASSGSACTSGSLEPSHVLRAMNISHMYAHGTIRFSLSKYTTELEIDKVIEVLPLIVERLRAISPFS